MALSITLHSILGIPPAPSLTNSKGHTLHSQQTRPQTWETPLSAIVRQVRKSFTIHKSHSSSSPRLRVIVQSHTHCPTMMPIILPNNLLATQLPQPCVMIRTRRNQIGRISTKRTIPHPPLMRRQTRLQWKSARSAFRATEVWREDFL